MGSPGSVGNWGPPGTQPMMPACSRHAPRVYTPWHHRSRRVNPRAARDGGREFLPGTRQLLTLPGLLGCCCDHPGWQVPISPRFQPGAPGLLRGANPGARRSRGTIKLRWGRWAGRGNA